MTANQTTALGSLLAVLVTDAEHHARCATRSTVDEAARAHDGMAHGLRIAALYVAELATTGAIRTRSAHRVLPEDQAAADRVLAALDDGPDAVRRAILGDEVDADTLVDRTRLTAPPDSPGSAWTGRRRERGFVGW